MRFTTHLHFVVLIFTLNYVGSTNGDYNKYISLISDVRNEYRATSVLFVIFGNNPSMQTYTMAHELSCAFSKRGVFTLITRVADLNASLDYHRNQIGRPIVVLIFESLDDCSEFINSRQIMGKSYAIWLAIFRGDSDKRLCDYCRRPVENTFRLRLDTLMFVLCCDAAEVQEWWSIDGARTEAAKFAIWTANERLKLLSNQGFNAKRSDLRGKGLRVIIYDPSTIYGGTSDPRVRFFTGFYRELKRSMNFTVAKLFPSNDYFAYNLETKKNMTIVSQLIRGHADLAIVGLPVGEVDSSLVDYSDSLLSSTEKLFIEQPLPVRGRFEVFVLDIWMIIIALTIVAPFLLAVIQMQDGVKSLGSLYLKYHLGVWGILCQQGLHRFPAGTPMRIAVISIYISAVVAYVAYSAKVISLLAVPELPFLNLTGFLKDGSRKLIKVRNRGPYGMFDILPDGAWEEIEKLQKPLMNLPTTEAKGWKEVCTSRVAFLIDKVDGSATNAPCKVVGLAVGVKTSLAMVLPAGSQYTAVLNYHIQRFKENGVHHRLKKSLCDGDESFETGNNTVDFSRVAPIFFILVGGVILSLALWSCEFVYSRIYNPRRLRSRRIKLVKKSMQKSFERWLRENSLSKTPRPRSSLRIRNFDPTLTEYCP